ncbi:MAG: T9SS type A sorting domain-containing protein [Salibacteraceae bacterium]|nr:T9SS type A sorting domain-containing protein [Salibacteraceae bacterium]
MKYRFLLLSSLLASASVFAQSQYTQKVKATAESSKQLEVAGAAISTSEGASYTSKILSEDLGPVLMYQGFDAGLPIDWTSTAINNAVWEYRGPSTTPASTVGSRGAYAGGGAPIASTSTADGFFIFDSDWWDNGGSPTGTGQQSPPHRGTLTSGVIDCSAEPNVLLTFETYLRNYQSFYWVIVSNDGFTTQDTVWNGADDYAINEASPADLFVKLNISATAGNSATAQVRFVFQSDPAGTLPGYYFWMIDDVTVSGAADFDLELEEVFFQGLTGSDEDFQYTNFYTQIPAKQMAATSLNFGGAIRSNSAAGSSNAKLNVAVSGAETFSSSSAPVTYSTFGAPDSVVVADSYVPATIGSYTVDFEVNADSADDFAVDNVNSKTFGVSEKTYAWGTSTIDDAVSWGGGTQSMYVRYDVYDANDSISAVEFGIWSSSTFASSDGSIVLVGVWPVTGGTLAGTGTVDFNNPIAQKYVTLSDPDDFNVVKKVNFDAPAGFPAGVTEVVAGYTYQSGAIRTANSDVPFSPLNAYVDTDSDGQIDGWVDMVPVINMVTYSSTVCQNTTVVVDAGVDCDLTNYTATIDAFAVGGQGAYTWGWSSGASTEDITVSDEGTYVATATDENFCVGTATFEITNASFNCNLSVNELAGETFNFTVQPNPSNGIFNLAFEALASERVNVQIQSIKGDVVYNNAINISNGTMTSLDLTSLSNGVYIMKVSGSANTVTERIIIQ